jgi:hypothetical protein
MGRKMSTDAQKKKNRTQLTQKLSPTWTDGQRNTASAAEMGSVEEQTQK